MELKYDRKMGTPKDSNYKKGTYQMARPKLKKTQYTGVYYYLKGTNQKVFVIKYKLNGIVKSKTIGSTPQWTAKLAYEAREKILRQEKAGGETLGLLRKKLDDAWKIYLEMRKESLSKSWYESNMYYYNKHISPKLGNRIVANIAKEDVQRIINHLLQTGYKPKTAKDIRDVIRAFYNYIRKDLGDQSIYNPAENIDLPKFDNKRVLQIDLEDAKRLYKAILTYPNVKYRTFFIFLLHGRRKSEVLNMRWEYIDFKKKEYIVPFEYNKIRKTMQFPMTDLLIEALKEYGISDEGYVFPNKKDPDRPASKGGGLDYHWKKIKTIAGLDDKDVVIHDLRHILGYISVNSGLPLEMIGKALGHQSTLTTKRYSNVNINSAAKVLENFFNTLSE